MNLKKEMLQVVDTQATDILNIQDESEQEARTLGFCNENSKADHVLYWLSSIKREQDELEEYKKAEIERITRFVDVKKKTLENKKVFFEQTLESYFQTCKGKSLSLSNGKFGTRKQRAKVEIVDETMFFEWHKNNANGEMVKVIEKPIKSGVMDYVKTVGECPPGVEYIEGKPQFYVRPEEL